MADMGTLIWPVRRRADFLRIVTYIAVATILVFVLDVITPLGVMIWILYFIPLFLTVYLSWKSAPHVMTGAFIFLMAASLFLSPRDISLELALLNRIFFALILIIASLFIRDYIANVEDLALSEGRHRNLIELLPEGVIVCKHGKIAYINPFGTRLFGADRPENLIGHAMIDMIDSGSREEFRTRTVQAAIGAQMDIDTIRIVRKDGSGAAVGVSLAAVSWDKEPAVQIIMRTTS